MTYTTEAKVEARLQGKIIDENSKPTTTQVTQFITDVEAYLDELLRTKGYDLPITDTEQLKIMSIIATTGVALKVERSCEKPRSHIVDELQEEYEQYLQDVKDGNILAKSSNDYQVHPHRIHSSHVLDSNVEDKTEDDDDFEFRIDTEF